MRRYADACWPVHAKIIESLEVQVVVCFGGTVGAYVRDRFDAHQEIDRFTERNDRRWTSRVHLGRGGVRVATVSHPSIANWRNPDTDVSDLVARALGGSEAGARPSAPVHRGQPAYSPPTINEERPKQSAEEQALSTEQINRGKGVGNLNRNPIPQIVLDRVPAADVKVGDIVLSGRPHGQPVQVGRIGIATKGKKIGFVTLYDVDDYPTKYCNDGDAFVVRRVI
ncbi:uracil-DNA glycosylase family protein [Nocardioides salsibiostraticola]